jgi:uncharacterized membrane protein
MGEGRSPTLAERRRMPLRERVRLPDSYGLLLVLILVGLVAGPALAAASRAWSQAAVLLVLGVTLAFALRTSEAPRRITRIAHVLVPLVVVFALAARAGDFGWADAAVAAVALVLTLCALAAVVVRLASHPVISWATVLGALCVYLLLGLAFVSVYGLLDTMFSASVFVDIDDPETFDFTYFSFVTLTTVGYGDVVAAQDLTRMVAVSEALIGQLYLVSIVALVVGNIGHRRRTGGGDPDGPEGGGADGDRAERPG